VDKGFIPPVSVERFAAYLDGNLTPGEMQQMDSLITTDVCMHMLADASAVIDEAVSGYSGRELDLPDELQTSHFKYPGTGPAISLRPSFDAGENQGCEDMAHYADEADADGDCSDDDTGWDGARFSDDLSCHGGMDMDCGLSALDDIDFSDNNI
jgi:hypothetical protein